MRFFVGVTDYDWFKLHASNQRVEEVNFWRPSPEASFKALQVGEPFLFKLHSPRNVIAGGGFFLRFLRLPVSLAWDAFGEGNGARSPEQVKARIGKYRGREFGRWDDPTIGCILLGEPFFFAEADWIPCPPDFSLNIVAGKGYDTGEASGAALWGEVTERLARLRLENAGPAVAAAVEGPRFGQPNVVEPRLGQGSFRVLVTEAYGRRCAITKERTLPVLDAVHIWPYTAGGPHALCNGLLLRTDLHRLFDAGYLTIDPDSHQVIVSRKIREEFENGKEYYSLQGSPITLPSDPRSRPSRDYLLHHAQTVFRS